MYRETITPLAYSDYSKNVVNAKFLRSKKNCLQILFRTTVQVHYLNKNAILRILQSNKAALIKKNFANLSAGESIILYNHLFTILAA
jgi:hypothetical protein